MKRLLPVAILAVFVAAAGIAVALAGGGNTTAGPAPITSADGISPSDCSLVHNVGACAPGEQDTSGMPVPDGGPITSIDDIDPGECNLVHNINACTPEDCERLGMTDCPVSKEPGSNTPVTSGDESDADECSLVHNVDACE